MSRVLNNELIYNEEDLPLQSHRRIAEFENNRGNLNGGGTAYIKIPNLRNGVLDCSGAFLKFTVQSTLIGTNLPHTTGGNDVSYNTLVLGESGAVSFIRKIDIFSNSALVASIDQANKLASIISVSNTGLNSQNAKSVCDGSSLSANGDLIGNVIADTYGRYTSAVGTKTVTPEMTFCINNGILACLGESTMPIFALKNGIEIQVEFESEVRVSYSGLFDVLVAGNHATITGGTNAFSNISYVCPVIEFEDSSMEAIVSRNGFGTKDVMWSGVGHHSSIVQLTTAEQTAGGLVTKLVANNRFKSLKSLHVGAFDAPSIGSGRGSYNTPKLPFNSIQYRMNGLEYPINKINTISKIVQNTISCHSNNSNSVGITLMKQGATALGYRQDGNAGQILVVPRAVSGLSLETWAETDSISGLDVSESDTEVLFDITAKVALASLSLCFVSTYDVIYVINELGVLSASSN